MPSHEQHELNLLELKPLRNAKWEIAETGLAVILIPKFRNEFLVRYLLPFFAKKNFRVKLDAFGSFLWKHCDGLTNIQTIGERMKQEFGVAADPVYERLGRFLRKLEREGFVSIVK